MTCPKAAPEQGFVYGEVAQIRSIPTNPKIIVTSHRMLILTVRVTENIDSMAMILVTLKSHFLNDKMTKAHSFLHQLIF